MSQKLRRRALRARLDRALQKAQASGHLHWFNAAFAAARCDNPTLNYRWAFIRLRNAILKRLVQRQPMTVETLKAEIFGPRRAGAASPVSEKASG